MTKESRELLCYGAVFLVLILGGAYAVVHYFKNPPVMIDEPVQLPKMVKPKPKSYPDSLLPPEPPGGWQGIES